MSTHRERGRHGGRIFVHKCLHTAMSLIIYRERRWYITHNGRCCLGAAAAPANLEKKNCKFSKHKWQHGLRRGLHPIPSMAARLNHQSRKQPKIKIKAGHLRLRRKLWLTHCRRQIWWQRRVQMEMLPPKTKVALGRIGRNSWNRVRSAMKPAGKPRI